MKGSLDVGGSFWRDSVIHFSGWDGGGRDCRAEECAAAAEPFAAATRTRKGHGMGRWGAMVELVGERGGEGRDEFG